MRVSDHTPTYGPVREGFVRAGLPVKVTDTTPGLRRMYRRFREAGLSRSDANMFVAGVAVGSGQATVSFGPVIAGDDLPTEPDA